ncbi:hypothetical protein L596_025773 [Steinernema carpocapsae]|uniref:Uncharacterized protein n=1 Tax=Steinernema carpocapsae TaxID=34508 RepID=A0A4U5M8T0_STECR|nr:hypothetical protein L596_025773 [Steinernema carpocapsae]
MQKYRELFCLAKCLSETLHFRSVRSSSGAVGRVFDLLSFRSNMNQSWYLVYAMMYISTAAALLTSCTGAKIKKNRKDTKKSTPSKNATTFAPPPVAVTHVTTAEKPLEARKQPLNASLKGFNHSAKASVKKSTKESLSQKNRKSATKKEELQSTQKASSNERISQKASKRSNQASDKSDENDGTSHGKTTPKSDEKKMEEPPTERDLRSEYTMTSEEANADFPPLQKPTSAPTQSSTLRPASVKASSMNQPSAKTLIQPNSDFSTYKSRLIKVTCEQPTQASLASAEE